MNKQEFDIWKNALEAQMNTVEGIGDYSSIGGAVGSHNNKTPDQVKRDNEKQLDLRRKIEEASIREQIQREKLKDDAKKEAKKQIDEEVIDELFGLNNKPAPVGLTGVKKELDKENKKDNDTPIGLAKMNRQAKDDENHNPPVSNNGGGNQGNGNIGHTGGNDDGNNGGSNNHGENGGNAPDPKQPKPPAQPQTHTLPKAVTNAEPQKSLGDKFKEGLKNVAKGAANAIQKGSIGAKMDMQDAKDWLKNNYKKVRKEEAEKRGHTAGYYSKAFKKQNNPVNAKAKEGEATKTSTQSAQSAKGTTKTTGGHGLNNTINIYNAGAQSVNDEKERLAKGEAEKAKFAQQQDEFNTKHVKNASGEQINKGKKGSAQTSTKSTKPLPTIDNKDEEGKKGLEAEVKKAKAKATKAKKSKAEETKPEVKETGKEEKPEVEPKVEEAPKATETEPKKTEEAPKEEVKANADNTEKVAKDDNKDGNKSDNAEATVEETPKPTEPKEEEKPEVEHKKDEGKKENTAPEVIIKGNNDKDNGDDGDGGTPDKRNKPDPKPNKPTGNDGEKPEKEHKKDEVKAESSKENEDLDKYRKGLHDEVDTNHKQYKENLEKQYKSEMANAKTDAQRQKIEKAYQERQKESATAIENAHKEADEKADSLTKEAKGQSNKEEESQKPEEQGEGKENTLKNKVATAKANAKKEGEVPTKPSTQKTPKTPEEKAEIRRRLQAKRDLEAKEKWEKRKQEMAGQKGGQEKSQEEIEANNKRVRAEQHLPDVETEDVKKHDNTVGSAWRQDFTRRANSGDTKDLPDKVKNLMGKYKEYWKKVNAKDFELSKNPEARAEGDRLENELKSVMNKYPEAFGKKTTVKNKPEEGQTGSKPTGKINFGALRKRKQEADRADVDNFINDTINEPKEPSDAELRAIEKDNKKKGK